MCGSVGQQEVAQRESPSEPKVCPCVMGTPRRSMRSTWRSNKLKCSATWDRTAPASRPIALLLGLIESVCDRVAMLRAGRVIKSPLDMLAPPENRSLTAEASTLALLPTSA